MSQRRFDETHLNQKEINKMSNSGEVTVSQSNGSEEAVSDVKAFVEAQLTAAYEEWQTVPVPEVAEPYPWWDMYAVGPIQPGAGLWPGSQPLLPNQIIRVGEWAYAVTVLIFSPQMVGILTPFRLPYAVTYSTGELTRWVLGPGNMQRTNTGNLTPGRAFAVDVFAFRAEQEGLYEMNISARVLDAQGGGTPPFAGFARHVRKIDRNLFVFEPNIVYDSGMRFQVYA
jgi:hypothetical protein